MRYYTIQKNNILIAENEQALTLYYKNVYPLPEDYEEGKYIIDNGILVKNPDYEREKLEKLKQDKYNEANKKAKDYLESGEALYEFEYEGDTYHIEATDGNIGKIGLKATALILAQDFETTFPWNTKEDININLTGLQGKEIAEGLGFVQDEVWTIKFPAYVQQIKDAETIEEVEAIVIDYTH